MNSRPSIFNIAFIYKGKRYLFNTRTGSLIQLDEGYYRIASDEEKALLVDLGFLVPNDEDEITSLESDVNAAIKSPVDELACTVMLTKACNFHCTYCYQTASHEHVSEDDCKAFLESINGFFASGGKGVRITYFGGEPLLERASLLHLDAGLKTLARSHHTSYKSEISTNGSLLDDELLAAVKFSRIRLTFDGDETWHTQLKRPVAFSYRDQINLVERILRTTQSALTVRFNICAENVDGFETLLDELCSLPSFDVARLSFEFARLRDACGTNSFTELSSEEYAHAMFHLMMVAKKHGIAPHMPQPASMPCEFAVGRAVCVGPGMVRQLCSELDEHAPGDGIRPNKRTIAWDKECKTCKVLPLCLGGCPLVPVGSECVPERYVLEDMLRDYLGDQDHWIIERGAGV